METGEGWRERWKWVSDQKVCKKEKRSLMCQPWMMVHRQFLFPHLVWLTISPSPSPTCKIFLVWIVRWEDWSFTKSRGSRTKMMMIIIWVVLLNCKWGMNMLWNSWTIYYLNNNNLFHFTFLASRFVFRILFFPWILPFYSWNGSMIFSVTDCSFKWIIFRVCLPFRSFIALSFPCRSHIRSFPFPSKLQVE